MRGESTRTRGGWQRAIAVVGVAVLVTLVGCLGGGGNSTAEDTVETPWGATETTPEPTTADVSGIDGSVRKCKSMDMSNHSVYSTTDHAGVRGSVEYTEDSTLMSVTIKVRF